MTTDPTNLWAIESKPDYIARHSLHGALIFEDEQLAEAARRKHWPKGTLICVPFKRESAHLHCEDHKRHPIDDIGLPEGGIWYGTFKANGYRFPDAKPKTKTATKGAAACEGKHACPL